MAKTPGTRWKREAARNPNWWKELRSPTRPNFQVRCVWSDKPGHLAGEPHPNGWRCPVCVEDWQNADALTRRVWRSM